jgi:hypothetical protein
MALLGCSRSCDQLLCGAACAADCMSRWLNTPGRWCCRGYDRHKVIEAVDVLLSGVVSVDPGDSEGRVGETISHSSVCTVSCVLNISIMDVVWAAHPDRSP